MARLRALGVLLLVAVVLGLGVAALAALVASWRDGSMRDAVGYSLCLVGALAVPLVGSVGGTARAAGLGGSSSAAGSTARRSSSSRSGTRSSVSCS